MCAVIDFTFCLEFLRRTVKYVRLGRSALCVSIDFTFYLEFLLSAVKYVSGWGEVLCVCVHWFYLFGVAAGVQ